MDRDFVTSDESLLHKLELLKILSQRDNVSLAELVSEIGLDETTILHLLNELKKNFILKIERDRVSWSHGDNPAKIKPWGWRYVYRVVLGSTMLSARTLDSWTIVIAEHQTRGYGRHGRPWISNLGGLWITAKLEIDPKITPALPMYIPTVLCRYFRERHRIHVGIKWPNDLIYKEKKIAGFLIEGEIMLDKARVYIGLGVNVNNDPPLETSTSLKEIIGKLTPRNSLISFIAGYLAKVEDYVKDLRAVQTEYLDLLETLGRRVVVKVPGGEIVGRVRSITETGELVLETDTGLHKFKSDEVLELRHLS